MAIPALRARLPQRSVPAFLPPLPLAALLVPLAALAGIRTVQVVAAFARGDTGIDFAEYYTASRLGWAQGSERTIRLMYKAAEFMTSICQRCR